VAAEQPAGTEAADVNEPAAGAITDWLVGFVVTVGTQFGLTVSAAALLVAEPFVAVHTAWYCVPLCAVVVAPVENVAEVAPLMFENDEPPGASDCH